MAIVASSVTPKEFERFFNNFDQTELIFISKISFLKLLSPTEWSDICTGYLLLHIGSLKQMYLTVVDKCSKSIKFTQNVILSVFPKSFKRLGKTLCYFPSGESIFGIEFDSCDDADSFLIKINDLAEIEKKDDYPNESLFDIEKLINDAHTNHQKFIITFGFTC